MLTIIVDYEHCCANLGEETYIVEDTVKFDTDVLIVLVEDHVEHSGVVCSQCFPEIKVAKREINRAICDYSIYLRNNSKDPMSALGIKNI